jgi:hypothetical protein
MSTPNRFLPALAMLGLVAIAAPSHAQLFPLQNDPNVFRCESVNSREVTCRIPDGRVAQFAEQHSSSPCTLGSTYWITRDYVRVTKGCRASFRLAEVGTIGSAALMAEMRTELAVALANRIRREQGFSATPAIDLQTERQREISSTQVGYDGTARVIRSGGNVWRTVEFTSVYDLRTRDITSLDYWTEGSRNADTSERRQLLRTELDEAMEKKLDSEYRNTRSNPRFELLTDEVRSLGSTTTGFSGTGRLSLDGNTWAPVVFDAVYDWTADRFTSLSYRPADGRGTGGGTTATLMDEDAERSLSKALAAEVRRQKGDGTVQIVINRRFRDAPANGKVTYTGKFGYSYNDGPWITRGYEAVLNPAGYNVRELKIYRLNY